MLQRPLVPQSVLPYTPGRRPDWMVKVVVVSWLVGSDFRPKDGD